MNLGGTCCHCGIPNTYDMNEALHISGIYLLHYLTILSKWIVLFLNIILFDGQSNEGSIVCIFKIRIKIASNDGLWSVITRFSECLKIGHGVCKQQQQDGDDNMLSIFTSKVQIWETLSINFDCVWAPSINGVTTESTSPSPAVVLHCVSSEHSPPVKRSLIWCVMVETGLCKHVCTTVRCEVAWPIYPYYLPMTGH